MTFSTALDDAISASDGTREPPAFAASLIPAQTPAPVASTPTQLSLGDAVFDGAALPQSSVLPSADPGADLEASITAEMSGATAASLASNAAPGGDEAVIEPASAQQAQVSGAAAGNLTAVPPEAAILAAAARAATPARSANAPDANKGTTDDPSSVGTSAASAARPIGASASGVAPPEATNIVPGAQAATPATGDDTATAAQPSTAAPLADKQSPASAHVDQRHPAQTGSAPPANVAQSSTQGATKPAAPSVVDAAVQIPDATQPATTPHTTVADALTAPAGASDAARPQATPPALQSAPAATIQVYTRIIERADGRTQRFEVRLDPAELGRVDVRIEIGADRKVHAVLAAHDSAALTDLMKGQRALERALADAGIDLADKGVRFELASDSGRNSAQQREGDSGRSSSQNVWRNFDTATVAVSAEAAAVTTPAWCPQRLDLVA